MTQICLGDEAVAISAIDAGIDAAFGYPGTPSTEIMEYLIREQGEGSFCAQWCTNEKTALEAALGVSFAGKRSIVTMKHVGLNVAADPFLNAALVDIKGGLVIAVADDPGMHSSQSEQDSRFYADFALIPAFEPRNAQQAYDMTREAFEISEKFHVIVILRLVTRLSHARSTIETLEPRPKNALSKVKGNDWLLLPAISRRLYDTLLAKQHDLLDWSENNDANLLDLDECNDDFAVITGGLGGNYYEENLSDYIAANKAKPAHLHIGCYPIPREKIRRIYENASRILIIEEGQPLLESKIRGILPSFAKIDGKLNGFLPKSGELNADIVRSALNLPPLPVSDVELPNIPPRPPQLCQGCPHHDSYTALKMALSSYKQDEISVHGDIGCYALGAAPPLSAVESIICMGASIGMARGAAIAGLKTVSVIGDSTFLHSGITALIDCVASHSNSTIVILDNSTVAMTGCQDTILEAGRIEKIAAALGVEAEHLAVLETKPTLVEENAERLKKEIAYSGVSVVIFKRECLEAARRRRKSKGQL
ncbi:MAG: thiamine pyrophosphate-dependent enzyme [Termitinemataceae bacterium]|nr:MAG: thiamine pyrophosphate-dependent enzyme [Termitinemataceae bacterium]